MSGTLYIVGTPIGNLGDVTLRAVEILKTVDFILAEDPRQTLKLLNHFGFQKKLHPYSDRKSAEKDQKILENLEAGQNYALVSDAGTPGISDPGEKLVELALIRGITVVPIPGVSAVATLVSVFGKMTPGFHFWGFFPKKKKMQKMLCEFFQTISGIHVFFESPYRVQKTLGLFLAWPDFEMVVGREMTKKFETFYRGTPQAVFDKLMADPVKGEFCIGLIKK